MNEVRISLSDIYECESPILLAKARGLPVNGVFIPPKPDMKQIETISIEEDYKTGELVIRWKSKQEKL